MIQRRPGWRGNQVLSIAAPSEKREASNSAWIGTNGSGVGVGAGVGVGDGLGSGLGVGIATADGLTTAWLGGEPLQPTRATDTKAAAHAAPTKDKRMMTPKSPRPAPSGFVPVLWYYGVMFASSWNPKWCVLAPRKS
jgi:hypothetical protein